MADCKRFTLATAGHKDPRATHRNYFTGAAKVKPLR
jgi:hypothetical protein